MVYNKVENLRTEFFSLYNLLNRIETKGEVSWRPGSYANNNEWAECLLNKLHPRTDQLCSFILSCIINAYSKTFP